MSETQKDKEFDDLTCDCMSKLGFKTCNVCIDYQRKYVYAIKERERRWAKALTDQD